MLRGGFGSVESLGKARNLAGGLLPMDDALGGGLIQRRGGGAQELRSGSLIISLDGGANRFTTFLMRVLTVRLRAARFTLCL